MKKNTLRQAITNKTPGSISPEGTSGVYNGSPLPAFAGYPADTGPDTIPVKFMESASLGVSKNDSNPIRQALNNKTGHPVRPGSSTIMKSKNTYRRAVRSKG